MDSYSENTQDNGGGDDDALSSLLLLLKANSGTEGNESSYTAGPYKSPRKMYPPDDRIPQDGDTLSLSNSLTIEDLRGYFHLPIVEVAKQLGTCTTALKKICRKHKIRKWPYRQIRSLTKSIQSLEMASLNDTMGDEVRDQYREQIVTLQKAIDDIVFDPNTNISALAKKLEAEWGDGEDDRMLDSEPSDNVRQIIQAAAATVGVEGNAKSSHAKRKLSQMETETAKQVDSSQSSGTASQQVQGHKHGGHDSMASSHGSMSSGPGAVFAPSRPSIPKKMPEIVSVGLTQVNQVALSVSDSKNTSTHFIGPVVLAPLERRRINKLVSKKLVPLIEPDICNHFKMEFLPQGPLLQVRFCQPPSPPHDSSASSMYSYATADPKTAEEGGHHADPDPQPTSERPDGTLGDHQSAPQERVLEVRNSGSGHAVAPSVVATEGMEEAPQHPSGVTDTVSPAGDQEHSHSLEGGASTEWGSQ